MKVPIYLFILYFTCEWKTFDSTNGMTLDWNSDFNLICAQCTHRNSNNRHTHTRPYGIRWLDASKFISAEITFGNYLVLVIIISSHRFWFLSLSEQHLWADRVWTCCECFGEIEKKSKNKRNQQHFLWYFNAYSVGILLCAVLFHLARAHCTPHTQRARHIFQYSKNFWFMLA